ncbi:MAG: ABC transporter ATP-binding protein [Gammaproteobacteria bacterium]|nr:ABC transporter ATP-binding protein [Gammaproteobacteria bacterium]
MNDHIVVKDLSKVFNDRGKLTTAFDNISLTIPRGQFCAIIGPSGCGKTSLLRVLAGLEEHSAGSKNIATTRQESGKDHRIGMVFQEPDLFAWMSLRRNVEFFLENNPRIEKKDIADITANVLTRVGLEDFADFLPGKVSGGMQQRVSIARCFANDADLLLMDEPFVFLDYQSRMRLHQVLLDIWTESEKTVIFVTHDIEEAVFLADRVVRMSSHPGQIVEDHVLDFERPRSLSDLRKDSRYVDLLDHLTKTIVNS